MTCKYMKTKNNYTPSDYDIIFDISDVPSNISMSSSIDIENILTAYTPLTRKLHLNLRTLDKSVQNEFELSTKLEINGEMIF